MAQSLRLNKVMNQQQCIKWQLFDDSYTPPLLVGVMVGIDQPEFDVASSAFTTLVGPDMEQLEEAG